MSGYEKKYLYLATKSNENICGFAFHLYKMPQNKVPILLFTLLHMFGNYDDAFDQDYVLEKLISKRHYRKKK